MLTHVSKGWARSQPPPPAQLRAGLGSYWLLSSYYSKEINLLRNTQHCFAKTPNITRKAFTVSCASLGNSLYPAPIRDKIHKDFPEKTRLTTTVFTNSVQQQSFFFFFCFITNYAAHEFSPPKRDSQLLPKNSRRIEDTECSRHFESSGIPQKLINARDLIV